MIYHPDPKALVYNEIQFLSVCAAHRKATVISEDTIFDEVALEMFNQFVAPSLPEVTMVTQEVLEVDALSVSEIIEVL